MLLSLSMLKDYLGIDAATVTDDALLTSCIERAQQQIESVCKRSFESSTGTYYYREEDIVTLPIGSQFRPAGSTYTRYSWDSWPGSSVSGGSYGHQVLWLGRDICSVSGLTNGDGTTITSTGYWLEPRNDPPYQWIRLRSGESWTFDTDGEIEVAGTWGYSTAAPDDITEALIRLAVYRYRLKDSGEYEAVATDEITSMRVKRGMPQDVWDILVSGGYVRKVTPK